MSVARSAVLGSAMLALAAAQEEAAPLLAIALKVAIIVFGLVSGGGVTGRSGDAPNALTQSDLTGGMCFLLYTGGDESKLSCIARAACESPSEADNYLSAAKLWYKMSKLIRPSPSTPATPPSWRPSTMPPSTPRMEDMTPCRVVAVAVMAASTVLRVHMTSSRASQSLTRA